MDDIKMVQLSDFKPEEADTHLTLRLINKKLNEETAKKCAYISLGKFLIAVPYWDIDSNASVLVDRLFSQMILHMTDDEVLSLARKNALKQQFTITGINEVMRQMLVNAVSEEILEEMTPEKPPFYVLTNESKEYGSIGLLSKDLLKQAEEVVGEGEFFIIPSSVHEVLLVPASTVLDPGDLKEMCKEVNDNEVAAEEILDYNIYRWNGNKIQVCNELSDLIDQRAAEMIQNEKSQDMKRGLKCV